MLNFLRKLRHDQINSKYLKYAFGEIVLVVIGILIALSINNWNEERQDRKLTQATLNNLRTEFQANLSSLAYETKRADSAIHAAALAFELFNKAELPFTDRELDSLISVSLYTPSWKPSDFMLQELKNSGSLNKLKDNELKRKLYLWTQQYNDLLELNNATLTTNRIMIEQIKATGSMKNIDRFTSIMADRPSNFKVTNRQLFYDLRFENEFSDKLYMLRRVKTRFMEINRQTEALVAYIGKTSD